MSASENSAAARPANPIVVRVRLKVLIAILTIIAVTIIYWSMGELSHETKTVDLLIFGVLALVTLPWAIALPETGAVVLFGETYLMAAAISHGTDACVLASACYALGFIMITPMRLPMQVVLFSFSTTVCEAFLYSTAYQLAKPANVDGIAPMVLPALAMALTSFASGAALTATAVSWTTGKGRMRVRFIAYLPLVVNSLLAATGASLIAAFFPRAPFVILAVAPLIGLAWGWTKTHKARLSRASAK